MSKDIFSVMADRRSIKRFSNRPVEMDKLLQVVQAGTLAPSSGDMQNWSFIIISDVDAIRKMYDITLQQEPFLSAMAAIVVCGDVEQAHQLYGMRGKRLYTIQNCAAAMQNMLLAAHALDLGAIWVGAFDEDQLSTMLGIPNHRYRPQAILLFGYADVEVITKDLKPLDSVVFFNRFGNKVQRPHLVYFDWATEWRNQAKKFKQHLQYVRGQHKEPMAEAPSPDEPVQRERIPSPEQMKKHMRSLINGLKKEQYRK